jgi:hypothetical protein
LRKRIVKVGYQEESHEDDMPSTGGSPIPLSHHNRSSSPLCQPEALMAGVEQSALTVFWNRRRVAAWRSMR